MEKQTKNTEANVNTEKLSCIQKHKGTSEKKYDATITGAPVTYEDLITLCATNESLQQSVMIALRSDARAKVFGRLGSLERAKQELFSSIDFVELMTTVGKKLTAASMCTRFEGQLMELAQVMQDAVMSGKLEVATGVAEEMKTKQAELKVWQEKRETERLAKVATREANKER